MTTGPNRTNRAALTVLGLLLLAAGVVGLVLSLGGFGAERAASAVLPEPVRTFAAENPWFWWVAAALAVLVALLGLRWLLAQTRTDRIGGLDLTTDSDDGLTTVPAGAVADAVEAEAEAIRGVEGATAHLREHGGTTRLDLAVDLADHADLEQVRAGLEDDVVPHVRQALDRPDLPVVIELRPGRPSRSGRGLA